jgi:hypothetical protein
MWELAITIGAGVAFVGGLVGMWLFSGWLDSRHRHHYWH